jgi:tricorn protease-like protein
MAPFFAAVGGAMLAACGDAASPLTGNIPPLENIAFESIGSGRVFLYRRAPDISPNGLYVIDVARKTVTPMLTRQVGAVSPDGRQIAYDGLTDFNSLWDVYVADLDGGHGTQVSSFPQNESSPAWTPDGKIVFAAGGAFYRQSPVRGATDRVRAMTIGFPSTCGYEISAFFHYPDVAASVGGDLAFTCNGRIIISPQDIFESHVYKIAPDGSSISSLYTAPVTGTTFGSLGSPSWSWDGRRVAFNEIIVERNTFNVLSTSLKVVNSDGSVVITIATGDTVRSGGWVCWTPDNSRILFAAVDTPDPQVSHLWSVRPDGTGLTQLTSRAGVTDYIGGCTR